jgi:hypothetical protein
MSLYDKKGTERPYQLDYRRHMGQRKSAFNRNKKDKKSSLGTKRIYC